MTMFSMKPKFDLAAFLAEPARPGTRSRPRHFRRPPAAATSDDTQEASDSDE